jgi:hypothetical protein
LEGRKKNAYGGRAGYNDGQLVTPSVDGSRPGYATSTVKKGKFIYPVTNQHGTIYSDKKPKKHTHEVGSGKFNMAERNRVTRIKFPEYNSYLELLKKEPAKAKNVMAALQNSLMRGTKITKKTVFTPLTEIQQNKILLEFPDAVFSKGKFGFNAKTDQTKFVQVKNFIKRGYKPKFAQLPDKVKNELKEKFSHFKDWDFKKFKYGVPETLNNVDNRRLMQKVKTFINDPKPWRFGFSMDQKGAWMTNQMYRAWEHGNTDYEPIYNKNDKVIGMKEKGKAYYANENVAPSKKAALINSHSEFNNIQKFVDVANEAKLPLKDLKGYKNTKALLALFPEGYEKIKFSDLTNYLYKEAGADATRNAIEKHHLKALSDIGSATDAKNLQLLRQDLNTLGNTVAEQIKKGDFSRVSDLEKAGVKIIVDGKTYGKGFQDPRRQLGSLIGETTQKIKSLDEQQFKNLLIKLCPKGKASGGRIGFQTAGSAVSTLECGRRAFTKLAGNGTAKGTQKEIINEILRLGSGLMKGAGQMLNPKEFFRLRNLVGPGAWAAMGAFEAGAITYDTINNNTPLNVALSDNWVTGWAMPWTKKEAQIKNLEKANISGSPAMQNYMERVKVMAEYERADKSLNTMKTMGVPEEHITNQQTKLDKLLGDWTVLTKLSTVKRDGKNYPIEGGEIEFQKAVSDMAGERKAGHYDPSDLSGVNKYGYTDVGESIFKSLPFIGDWFKQGTPLKKDPQIVKTSLPPQLSTSGYHQMPKYDVDLTRYEKQPGVKEATTTPLDADTLQTYAENLRNIGLLEPRGGLPQWYIDMVQKNEKWRQLFEQSPTGLFGSKFASGGRAGYMGGGITGIRKPSEIPPLRQGLRSIMINGKKS